MGLWSNVVWAQDGDHLGRPLMDLGFAFEILWEPAAPRLDQRLLRLRLMPKARGHESSIPPPLEFGGDLGERIGHRWLLLPCIWGRRPQTARSSAWSSSASWSPVDYVGPRQPHGRPGHPGRPKYLQQLLLGLLAGCRGFIAVLPAGERIRVAALLPPMSQAFNDSEPELAVGAGMGSSEKPSPGSAPRPMSAHTGSADGMVATISDGTDVWVTVPASPPLRMTIRACLNDRCAECRLPVYRCESEAGQMLRLCASHLRLLN